MFEGHKNGETHGHLAHDLVILSGVVTFPISSRNCFRVGQCKITKAVGYHLAARDKTQNGSYNAEQAIKPLLLIGCFLFFFFCPLLINDFMTTV